ncbi:hypothetical protein [Streptomyces sp. NPDC020747]|uniref:hypothetical protein n=1 Tax=Streptomyces sp. NPDC020747 TaxID=3365086 RepID=UPI0037B51927
MTRLHRADRHDGPGPHPAPDRRPAAPLPARLFDAPSEELKEIAADALREVYFQDGGCHAGSLEEVRFTDIEHLEFDL